MVIFAHNRKLSASASAAPKNQGETTPWDQLVHSASVQKSTVFALKMRGQFKKAVVSTVR
jgi:hypothetical protein